MNKVIQNEEKKQKIRYTQILLFIAFFTTKITLYYYVKHFTMNKKILTIDNLNPRVIDVEYAVRGPIVIRAAEIEKEIKQVFL
jgi:hypothetical protein